MRLNLEDIKRKEVIDISNGERLGYIDDAVIDIQTSTLESLVIYGRNKLFGLLGKEDDISIPCSKIKVIGNEVVLVDLESHYINIMHK